MQKINLSDFVHLATYFICFFLRVVVKECYFNKKPNKDMPAHWLTCLNQLFGR